MYWILLIIGVGIFWHFAMRKTGKLDFWKSANAHADEAFDMFNQEDCWRVFYEKPQQGYKSELPEGDWDGPFIFVVPRLGNQRITIFGNSPEYQKTQQRFLEERKTQSG